MFDLFLILFGLIMIMVAWRSLNERLRLRTDGVEAVARVVEIQEIWVDGYVRYRPVYAFQDTAGIEHRLPTARSGYSTNRETYTIGASKRIIYDPEAPHAGAFNAGAKGYAGLALYALIGLGVIAIARMNGWVE